MTDDRAEKEYRDVINASGYVFQQAVEYTLTSRRDEHPWRVEASEHPWQRADGSTGFIDLVLASGGWRLVADCKRVRDGTWVFPVTGVGAKGRSHGIWLHGYLGPEERLPTRGYELAWRRSQLYTESIEAEFCAVRGRGEGDRSMLERMSQPLLDSVEDFARQEMEIADRSALRGKFFRGYVPVIMTNARLVACRYDPENVDLSTGKLPAGAAEYDEVPLVRFRKALARPQFQTAVSLEGLRSEAERTVLVVSTERIVELLRAFEFRA